MVKLSVNINKIATLRNARGGSVPDVLIAASRCEEFGADGITVHPRPDERHIRYSDTRALSKLVKTEFNIEGYPNEAFIQLVLASKPAQVTLVPDSPDVLTSNAGWDAIAKAKILKPIIEEFKNVGIRTSLFMECDLDQITAASEINADRIELYTESYAQEYDKDPAAAVMPYANAARHAIKLGLGLNAGHDLNRNNLGYFVEHVPGLREVSIGHALISDALYLGLENTIQLYQKALGK